MNEPPDDDLETPSIRYGASYQVLSQAVVEAASDPGHTAITTPESQRYEPRLLLGMGGMGRVEAVWDRRLAREVARKTPRKDAGSFTELLVREALVTARIDHPGVVPIFDVGVGVEGLAYYTMPIVKGRTLAERLSSEPQRLTLLRRVLDGVSAVAAAHAQGIAHGDLKPANIILGEQGGTRVLDWGLARLLDEADPRGVTGTPQYMSPEQANAEPWDQRADVWSLGAILYELCVGAPLRSQAETPPTATVHARLASVVPSELASIVTRAVATRPADRYPDAAALSEDLAAWLDGRRVAAYDYSPRELLWRFVKAWRLPLSVATIALFVIGSMLVVGLDRLGDEVLRAEAAADRARHAERLARDALAESSTRLSDSLTSLAIGEANRGARARAEVLAAHALGQRESPTLRGVVATWSASPPPMILGEWPLPDCAELVIDPTSRGFLCKEASALSAWRIPEGPGAPTLLWRRAGATQAMHLRGDRVASFETNRELHVQDLSSGATLYRAAATCEREVRVVDDRIVTWNSGCLHVNDAENDVAQALVFPCLEQGVMTALAFSSRLEEWAAICRDGTLGQGPVELGAVAWRTTIAGLSDQEIPLALAFDGPERLAIGTSDGRLVLIERATGEVLYALRTGLAKVTAIETTAEGLAFVRSALSELMVFDLRARAPRMRFPETDVRAFAVDGDRLFVAAGRLREYRLARGPVSDVDLGAGVTSVTFSPDGLLLGATTGARFEIRALSDGRLVGRWDAGVDFIKSGAFSPDGATWVLSASVFKVGPTVPGRVLPNIWQVDGWVAGPTETALHARRAIPMADGSIMTLPYLGGIVAVRPDRERNLELVPPAQRFADLASSFDGRFAAAVGELDGQLVLVRAAEGEAPSVDVIGFWPLAVGVDVSEAGDLIAGAGLGGVWLWDTATGRQVDSLVARDRALVDVALSRDGRWVAAGSKQGDALLWSLPEGVLVARFAAIGDRVSTVEFSPDGRWLASGSWDGHARLFDLARVERPPTLLVEDVERAWGLDLGTVMRRE